MPLAERRHLTVIDTRLGGIADSNMTVARRQRAPEPRRQIEGEAQLSSIGITVNICCPNEGWLGTEE
jgi:hypothetical protein